MTSSVGRPVPGMGASAEESLTEHTAVAVEAIAAWIAEFGGFEPHPSLDLDPTAFTAAHRELLTRLRHLVASTYPYPRTASRTR